MEEASTLANIRVIDLCAILAGDHHERRNLLSACCEDGFFYLDYSSQPDVEWQETLDHIKKFYDNDLGTKMRFWRGRNKTGYKPLGIDPGVDEQTKDGYESFRVGQMALRGSPSTNPYRS